MKPMRVLQILDRQRQFAERMQEKYEPHSKDWLNFGELIAALSHAARLVAFEVQHINTLKADGEYRNNRRSGKFLGEVAQAAPKED